MSTRPLNSISSPNSMPLISYTYQCIMYQYTNLRIPLYVRFYHTRDSEANFARFVETQISNYTRFAFTPLERVKIQICHQSCFYFSKIIYLCQNDSRYTSQEDPIERKWKRKFVRNEYEFLFFKFVIFLLVQSHLNGGTAFDFPREWSAS